MKYSKVLWGVKDGQYKLNTESGDLFLLSHFGQAASDGAGYVGHVANRLVPHEVADNILGKRRPDHMIHGRRKQARLYAIDVNAGWRMPVTGLLCKQQPYGGIRFIDLESGKTLWGRPFGTARRTFSGSVWRGWMISPVGVYVE